MRIIGTRLWETAPRHSDNRESVLQICISLPPFLNCKAEIGLAWVLTTLEQPGFGPVGEVGMDGIVLVMDGRLLPAGLICFLNRVDWHLGWQGHKDYKNS